MRTFSLVGLGSGILFGVMAGLISANSLAQRLYQVYKPIARTSINAPAGVVIDLLYGFILAGLFLLLRKSLPGTVGWTKGLSFGLLAWFFRVLMNAASQWIMFRVSTATLAYTLLAGLGEMMILGVLYGLTLRPKE